VKRNLTCLAIGVYFGIVLLKSEVASWWRIQEMFHFEAIHMYGIIGIAVALGALTVWLVQRLGLHAVSGERIELRAKPIEYRAQLLGGIVFGCGWALTGACPGPMYALVGAGYLPMIVVLLSAVAGTYVYGLVREKLPH
jgi:uncharacterized membrane protein YedE/YeeE